MSMLLTLSLANTMMIEGLRNTYQSALPTTLKWLFCVRYLHSMQIYGQMALVVRLERTSDCVFRTSAHPLLETREKSQSGVPIMANINTIPSAIRPFAAILSFEVPTTELDPDFVPSISVCVGEFETLSETEIACRSYANHPALIAMRAYQSMLASDYVGGGV